MGHGICGAGLCRSDWRQRRRGFMSPEALLEKARAAGLTLKPDGQRLRVRPAERLTPELRSVLLEHKSALLAILQSELGDADLAKRITLRGGAVVSLRAVRLGWQLEARGHVLSVID